MINEEEYQETQGSGLRKVFGAVVFTVQLIASAILSAKALSLGLIPDKYLYGIVITLWLSLMVSALLLFVGIGHGGSLKGTIKRIAAFFLAAVICVVSVFGYKVMDSTKSALKEVSSEKTASEDAPLAVMSLYVAASDPAKSSSDCREYIIGVASGFNGRFSKAALNKMSAETGIAIQSVEYDSEDEMIEALYDGEISAILISSAQVEILSETEAYSDLGGKIRLIREYDINAADMVFIPKDAASASIPEVTLPQDDTSVDGTITKTPFILYLSGSDTRNKQFKTSRSDVNILMAVNPNTKQILLLNTPRDYYIPNPKSADGDRDKLTHLGLYGVNCSMQGLSDLYGCTINYSVQINFTGFETLIDQLGGITINNPQSFTTVGYTFKKGTITLNGKEALVYARERHSFATGDNMRGQNQMRIITAMIKKATSSKSQVLKNYNGILNALSGMFKTSMPSSDIEKLIKMQLGDLSEWKITSYAVTGKNGSETTYSSPKLKAYVMWPDDKSVAEGADKIKRVMEGKEI